MPDSSKPNDGSSENTEHSAQNQEIKRALTAGTGELYTLRSEESSLIIGRSQLEPIENVDDDVDDYPETPASGDEYDTWLG